MQSDPGNQPMTLTPSEMEIVWSLVPVFLTRTPHIEAAFQQALMGYTGVRYQLQKPDGLAIVSDKEAERRAVLLPNGSLIFQAPSPLK